MVHFLGYVAVFIAGVVLDEVFGARLLAKFEVALHNTEQNLVVAFKTEVSKLTAKL